MRGIVCVLYDCTVRVGLLLLCTVYELTGTGYHMSYIALSPPEACMIQSDTEHGCGEPTNRLNVCVMVFFTYSVAGTCDLRKTKTA